MKRFSPFRRRKAQHNRGQSMLEFALVLPVLLILLSGLVEIGFLLVDYLALEDATRNAARFASDGYYYVRDNDTDCTTTRDFFRQTACDALMELSQERPTITLDANSDDIVISAVAILQGSGVIKRFPQPNGWWSYYHHFGSRVTDEQINNALDPNAPNTGMVVVETYYHYHQKLKLPWIEAFLPDPILLHAYAVMPLVSAEPTPTPAP